MKNAITDWKISLGAALELARSIDQLDKNCQESLEFASKHIASAISAIEPLLAATVSLCQLTPASIVTQPVPPIQNEERNITATKGPEYQKVISLAFDTCRMLFSPVEGMIFNLQRAYRDGQERSSPLVHELEALSIIGVKSVVASALAKPNKLEGGIDNTVRSSRDLQTLADDEDKTHFSATGRTVPSNKRRFEIPAFVPPQTFHPIVPIISGLPSAPIGSPQKNETKPSEGFLLSPALSIVWSLMQSSSPYFSNAWEVVTPNIISALQSDKIDWLAGLTPISQAMDIGTPRIISALQSAGINRSNGFAPIGHVEGIKSSLAASDFLLRVVYSLVSHNAIAVSPKEERFYLMNIGTVPRMVDSLLQNISRQNEEATHLRPGGNTINFHNTFNIQIQVDHAEERELKDLGRSIGQILSDEMRRYGGIS